MYLHKGLWEDSISSAPAKGQQEGARGLYVPVDLGLKKLGASLTGSEHRASYLISLTSVSLSEKWDHTVILKGYVKSTEFGVRSKSDSYSVTD